MPPEAWFVLGAVSMYLGSALAVTAFARVDVVAVAWLRLVGAAAVLWLCSRPWRSPLTVRRFALVATFGLVTTAMNTAFYLAIDRLPLGTAVAVEFIGPVAVVAALSRTGRNLAALGLTAAGVLAVSGAQWQGNPGGVAWALVSAALWAGYILFGSRVALGGDGLAGLATGLAVGALVLAPLAAPRAGPAFASVGLMALCLAVGLLSNAVPYGLDQLVLRRVSPDRFALLLSILPVTAAVIGAVALGQVPTAAEAAGIGAVVAALAIRDRTGERGGADVRTFDVDEGASAG